MIRSTLVLMSALSLSSFAAPPKLARSTTGPTTDNVPIPGGADGLALNVMRSAGADAWPSVKVVHFTFNVEAGGKPVASAKHVWDVKAGTDIVTWKDKTVTVNLMDPPKDGDGHAAFQRWTNDSYWLLMPLKLMDNGVTLSPEPEQTIDGKKYQMMHLSFSGVGLTPGDQYNVYVDPDTMQVRAFDYMPKPGTLVHATWDNYKDFNGLKLATDHKMGDKQITFTDVAVER